MEDGEGRLTRPTTTGKRCCRSTEEVVWISTYILLVVCWQMILSNLKWAVFVRRQKPALDFEGESGRRRTYLSTEQRPGSETKTSPAGKSWNTHGQSQVLWGGSSDHFSVETSGLFINNPQFGNIKPVWKYHVCFLSTGHQGNCQGWAWVFKENAREKTKTISCWIGASTHATGWLVPNQAGQEPESCATAKAEIELCVWSDANLEDLRSLEKQPVREGTFQLRFKSSLHLSLPLHRVWAKGLLLQRPFATGSAHKWTWNCFISVINYLFCLYWPLWGFCTLVHLSCWTFNYISKCTFFFRILFQTKVNYLKHFYMFAGVLYIAGDLCMFLFVGVLPNFLIG